MDTTPDSAFEIYLLISVTINMVLFILYFSEKYEVEYFKKSNDLRLSHDELDLEIAQLNKHKEQLIVDTEYFENILSDRKLQYQQFKAEIRVHEDDLDAVDFGFSQHHFDEYYPEEFKQDIKDCKEEQKELIKDKSSTGAIWCDQNQFNVQSGVKLAKIVSRLTVRAFNNECDVAILKCTAKNHARIEQRIKTAFESMNNMNKHHGVSISEEFLTLKLDELGLIYSYQLYKINEGEDKSNRRHISQLKKLTSENEQLLEQICLLQQRHNELEKHNETLVNEWSVHSAHADLNKHEEVSELAEESDPAEIQTKLSKLQFLKASCLKEQLRFDELQKQIAIYDAELEMIDLGLYKPQFDYDTSEEFKDAVKACKEKQKDFLRDKTRTGAIYYDTNSTVESLEPKDKALINTMIRLTARAFNSECDAAIASCTSKNAERMILRIKKAFETMNTLNESNNIHINKKYLRSKIKELRLTHEYHETSNHEQEKQVQLKAQKQIEKALNAAEANYEQVTNKQNKQHEKALNVVEVKYEQEVIKQKKLLQKTLNATKAQYEKETLAHKRELETRIRSLEKDLQKVHRKQYSENSDLQIEDIEKEQLIEQIKDLKNRQNELEKHNKTLIREWSVSSIHAELGNQQWVTDSEGLADDTEIKANISKLQILKQSCLKEQLRFDELEKQIAIYDEELEMIDLGLYKPQFDNDTSVELKEAVKACKDQQKDLLRDKTRAGAIYCGTPWRVANSESKGKSMIDKTIRLTARAFNNECEAAIANCTWKNAQKMIERIKKAFEIINELNAPNDIHITKNYLKVKLKELRLIHEYKTKKQREKEEQAEIQAQMREEAKIEQEIKKAQEEAIKEQKQFEKALMVARVELNKAISEQKQVSEAQKQASSEQKQALEDRVKALEIDLQAAQSKHQRALSMAEQTKQGYVYVISNIGSFGENVYKIGMTRRLEPMERVKELSAASVPFVFDVHAMIHTKDAPALEKALHKKFDSQRLNKVNQRKEFFEVSLQAIRKEVESITENKAEFIETAVAQEYYESQRIIDAQSESNRLEKMAPNHEHFESLAEVI
jgi:hypothetical protein